MSDLTVTLEINNDNSGGDVETKRKVISGVANSTAMSGSNNNNKSSAGKFAGRPGSGKYGGKFSGGSQFHDQQSFQCQFCTFMCRRNDEMNCHYREKHDYAVQKAGMGPVAKTGAPTRHSLIFSPSNYIFISNPGEYLLDVNSEQKEGVLTYVPGFLNKHDADDYFFEFKKKLPWVQLESFSKKAQKDVKESRMSVYYGPNYEYGPVKWQNKEEFDPKVEALKALVEKHCDTTFNSALGILYRSGRDHMGWHSDDEPELGKYPTIASISFGATRYFEFSRIGQATKLVRLALKHGDLLITSGCIQEMWKHWVPRDPDVAHCRVNITFRNVDPSKRIAKPSNTEATAKA